jgi:hypothetical protein
VSKVSRKQARQEQWESEHVHCEEEDDDDEYLRDDKDLDNAEDDSEEDEDEEDLDDEYNDEESPLTMEEKKLMGIDFVSQEEIRIAVKVAYVREFHSPDECDWQTIVTTLNERLGVSRKLIHRVFRKCRDGVENPEKQKKGAGRKHRLDADNEGLIAGAAALNGSASPKMATEICNAVNKAAFPELFETDYKVCRNTFMSMLKAHTDFDSVAILRRKTGSKDPTSKWAIARATIASQMLEQIELGKKIDNGDITQLEAFENVEKNDVPPPIFPDAVIHVDENHCISSIGGAGHEGSFSRRQHRVAVDPQTGKLLRKARGGVVPSRKYRVVAKYTEEARGCYGVCKPVIDGREQGQFIKSFNYTAKKLVSLKAYKKLMRKEMTYRRGMKSGAWKNFNGENPYEERYGDNWEEELKKAPSMKKYR